MSGHGGNITRLAEKLGCKPAEILDFSANINPLGPPAFLRRLINTHIPDLVHYPDPDCRQLVADIAQSFTLTPQQIVVGNGTSELLFQLPLVLQPKRAIIPAPAYIDYALACQRAGIPTRFFPLAPEQSFKPDLRQLESGVQPGDLVILGQPNNPTGQMNDRAGLVGLAQRHPDVLFLIDEAFAGFVPSHTSLSGSVDNLLVLYSLTKIFAIPGLRLGFLAAAPEICNKLLRDRAPWSVNTLAQVVGCACLNDKKYLEESRLCVAKERQRLMDDLGRLPSLHPLPSDANFICIRCEHHKYSGTRLADTLLNEHHISIRVCENYQNLDQRYFRIAVRPEAENKKIVQALRAILHPPAKQNRSRPIRKKPALMLLGTGSDVGKSILVAALGRIFLQDGLRVAPFKAQNMSLNSYVTRDGEEMGRAQVVQAQACMLDPDVRMNPILLKPNSDVGSQIIVNGRPVGNMKVCEYVAYKKQIWQQACRAYDSLTAEHDVMLLEGAGSPGEVNLKSHDIVNTKMARYAGAKALLVGDIDRGGVYASFIGHVEVMEPWERDLLAGFVVNRFRGDASLLDDAHKYVSIHTGKPVLGVIPYMHDLGLPQEDSVGFKAGLFAGSRPEVAHVEVVLIDLPHISNFTDIEPLLAEPDVFVRIVDRPENFGHPAAIILPGSKNVAADLDFIRKNGLDKSIVRAAETGVEIVGICGGFQMLGHRVNDPHGLESGPGSSCRGLGLLDMITELARAKTLTRKKGRHLPSGCPVHGYEIHHGISACASEFLLAFDDGTGCGYATAEGHWGSYLHGIFDSDAFRRWWIDRLRRKIGLKPHTGMGAVYDLEPALDRLADKVRDHLDMDVIYQLLSL
jgi:cobyric acid synthase CobQ/L-threonine-O-3-phosphate decarboxylase